MFKNLKESNIFHAPCCCGNDLHENETPLILLMNPPFKANDIIVSLVRALMSDVYYLIYALFPIDRTIEVTYLYQFTDYIVYLPELKFDEKFVNFESQKYKHPTQNHFILLIFIGKKLQKKKDFRWATVEFPLEHVEEVSKDFCFEEIEGNDFNSKNHVEIVKGIYKKKLSAKRGFVKCMVQCFSKLIN